jgi:5-formyltetrahydrofolate cyclo-ligase
MFLKRQYAELTKSQIRNKIISKLRKQKEEQRDRRSRLIKRKLFTCSIFKNAKRVMFYISFGGEVKTEDMIKEANKLGKMVAVPVCIRNRIIRACAFKNSARLKKGPYGIPEPVVKSWVNLKDMDLVVVPGLAFDEKGLRLGRGKGYYDRFLKRLSQKTSTIGLAFSFQILPHIPATATDVSVDRVIFA